MSSFNPSGPNSASVINSNITPNGTTAARTTSVGLKASSPSRVKQASSAWYGFEDALKTITQYSPVFSEMATAMDKHSAMVLESKTKDKRIAALESSIQIQTEESAKRYNKWDEERSEFERKVANTRAEVTTQTQDRLGKQKIIHVEEMDKLTKELDAQRQIIATLKEELEKANTKKSRLEEELSHCMEQMSEWEGYVSQLKDIDFNVFDGKVQQLFTRCRKIARVHFFRDLPDKFFEDPRWENLHRSLDVPLRFPHSNSLASKHVRMATCLHVLARRLCADFFKPCYIPGPPSLSEAIKHILIQQSKTDVVKESIIRAFLLSAHSPEQVDAAIKQAVDTASKDVLELLSSIGGDESFRKAIDALFREAAGVWMDAQRSKKMVEASMVEDFEWQWSYLDEFTVAEIKAQPGLRKFDMLHLFPRVYVPEDDYIVNPGYVLWPNQNTVFAAEQEARECMAVRRSKGGWNGSFSGGSTRRERRTSALPERRNGNIAPSPTSLKADDKPRFLGTQRVQAQESQTQNGNHREG